MQTKSYFDSRQDPIFLLRGLLFFSSIALIAFSVNAQVLSLDNNQGLEVDSIIQFVVTDEFSPQEIELLYSRGKLMEATQVSYSESASVYWLAFSVTNNSEFDQEWIFDFEGWSLIDFHYKGKNVDNEDSYVLKQSGHLYPYSKRDYQLVNKALIVLPMKGGGHSYFCLVRLENIFNNEIKPNGLEFKVFQRSEVERTESFHGNVIFTFLGVLAIMFFYNLFLFLTTKLKSQAYYLIVIAFAFYHTLYNSGYIIPLFASIDLFPVLLTGFERVSSILFGISVVLFADEFLAVKRRYPTWHKTLKIILYGYFACLILILISYDIGYNLSGLVSFATILVVISIGIKSVKDKYPSAVYFLIGYSAFFVGVLIAMLTFGDILPSNSFTLSFALPLGTTIQVALFSLAIGNLINVLRKENEEKQTQIIHQLEENHELQQRVTRELETKVQERTAEIENEKAKSDELLLNILPSETADELKRDGHSSPKYHENVTVLLADIVDFSEISTRLSPQKLVEQLDFYFKGFDEVVEKNELEKIKTIGDAYMVASLHSKNSIEKQAYQVVKCGLEMIQKIQKNQQSEKPWKIRVGINTGPITSGVVGRKKFAFDIWGDTVNLTSRLESNGEPNRVNISRHTYELVKDRFEISPRGKIEVKNIGEVEMYFVLSESNLKWEKD